MGSSGPPEAPTFIHDTLRNRTPTSTLPQWIATLPTRISNWTQSIARRLRPTTQPEQAIELKENTERTPHPNTGIPPPNAFYFRLSDVDEYRDIFTLVPLTRQDFPPPDLPLPAPSLTREEPRADHRVPVRDCTPIPSLPPNPHQHTVPPLSQHTRGDSSSSDRDSTEHNPTCRLDPANFLMRFDGFPAPEMLFVLESVDGGPPPHFQLQYGSPISILSLTSDPSIQEIWPVEAIRFDHDTDRAIIIASYEGCAVPVLVPLHIVDKLPNRMNIWRAFRTELAGVAGPLRHSALSRADLTRIHDDARGRIVSELKNHVSPATAPDRLRTHVGRLLGVHALPGS